MIVSYGPVVRLIEMEVMDMSNGTYFAKRLGEQQEQQARSDRHEPSGFELDGMKRRIEEALAYAMLDLERLKLPVSISAPLQRAVGDLQSVIESIQVQQSEADDVKDGH